MSFFNILYYNVYGDSMILRKAVLLIHGFAGGTYDMESLAWRLGRNSRLDVYEFTLPGHGRKESSKYTDWIAATEEKVETLINYGYSDIYVVGHSMGCVLACYVASKYPQIKKVVLAAPAFKYITEKDDPISIKKTKRIVSEYGISELIFRGFGRVNITTTGEFKKLVKEYQDVPKKIKVPILIFQGLKDDVVPVTSSEYVFDSVKSDKKGLVYLKKSNHDIFNGPMQDEVNERITVFLLKGKMKEKETI